MNEFHLTIPTKKRAKNIIFLVVFLLIILFKEAGRQFNNWFDLFWVTIALIVFIYLGWILFGNVNVRIKEGKLILRSCYFIIPFHIKRFRISDIKDVHIAYNTKANTYTGWKPGTSLIRTPEYLRTYDKNPTVISFEYIGKRIRIGEGLEEFNAESIRNEIKRYQ